MTQEFTSGDRVTVTYDDGTRTRSWHGLYEGTQHMQTIDRGETANTRWYPRWQHAPMSNLYTYDAADADTVAAWVSIARVTDRSFEPQGLPVDSPNWTFEGLFHCAFRADLPGLSITPITAEGQRYLKDHESASSKRTRLIARLREFDAAAADELDNAIEALIDDGYDRGHENALYQG